MMISHGVLIVDVIRGRRCVGCKRDMKLASPARVRSVNGHIDDVGSQAAFDRQAPFVLSIVDTWYLAACAIEQLNAWSGRENDLDVLAGAVVSGFTPDDQDTGNIGLQALTLHFQSRWCLPVRGCHGNAFSTVLAVAATVGR